MWLGISWMPDIFIRCWGWRLTPPSPPLSYSPPCATLGRPLVDIIITSSNDRRAAHVECTVPGGPYGDAAPGIRRRRTGDSKSRFPGPHPSLSVAATLPAHFFFPPALACRYRAHLPKFATPQVCYRPQGQNRHISEIGCPCRDVTNCPMLRPRTGWAPDVRC